jgi:hypothetical protein
MKSDKELTPLQNKILELFKSQESYSLPLWGFSAMGFREVSRILGISAISASNSMRIMLNKGIFYQSRARDRWDDTTYYLRNPEINKESN